jgi:alpha-glucoside transport system permease protein
LVGSPEARDGAVDVRFLRGRTARSIAAIGTFLARALVSLAVPVIAFIVLYLGFVFLKDADAPRIIVVLVAHRLGVGGTALLYYVANWTVERLPATWRHRVLPFVFVGPAMAILAFTC